LLVVIPKLIGSMSGKFIYIGNAVIWLNSETNIFDNQTHV